MESGKGWLFLQCARRPEGSVGSETTVSSWSSGGSDCHLTLPAVRRAHRRTMRRLTLIWLAGLVVIGAVAGAWFFRAAPAVDLPRIAKPGPLVQAVAVTPPAIAPAQAEPVPVEDAAPAPAAAPAEPFVVGEFILPVSPTPVKQRAAAQVRSKAFALFKKKRFAAAQPLLELAVRLDPDSPEGAERLGAVLARNGDAPRAIFFYDRFLELAPADPLALDLKQDVDSYLTDHPNPALQLMRDGPFRRLSKREASLQSELARRLLAGNATHDPDGDLTWFLAELELLRQRGELGPLVEPLVDKKD